MNRRLAVIMAGGSGERFWPVSTRLKPKQFLKLASPTQTLLEQAVERAASCTSTEETYIATGRHLVDLSQKTCPQLPVENVLAEPAKRNTTGCLVWVAANLIAKYSDTWPTTTLAILTADQLITPQEGFESTFNRAMTAAEEHGAIVTIGIRPTRPETGFGYIECGGKSGDVLEVKQFREKPDVATANEFISAGNFLWNSGMFFYTLPTFMSEMALAQPTIAEAIRSIAGHLAQGELTQADAVFESLPNISIDFALMEKSKRVLVTEADFEWDDLGAWDSVARSYSPDSSGNVALGSANLVESSDNVVYNETDSHEVCLLGIEGMAVVVTGDKILVIPKDRAQEVKKFLNP
ncbi:MAG: NTP transferase domain-containing protein [Fimbriimonadaceae bacterium]|nr:NTP transferase domain-containing protein [Fimbriimonadaceae bacterium]